MTVDVEKGTLTVIGDADPVIIVKRLRKTGKAVTIISVGENTPTQPGSMQGPATPCCRSCQPVSNIGYVIYDDTNWCTIL